MDYYLETIEHDYYKLITRFELKDIQNKTIINLKDFLYALETARHVGQTTIKIYDYSYSVDVNIDKLIEYLKLSHFDDCKTGVIDYFDNGLLKVFKEKQFVTDFYLEV
jgi:hypothetical protein